MQPAYIPTVEDILRVRVRSNGVTEASFMFDRRKFLYVIHHRQITFAAKLPLCLLIYVQGG